MGLYSIAILVYQRHELRQVTLITNAPKLIYRVTQTYTCIQIRIICEVLLPRWSPWEPPLRQSNLPGRYDGRLAHGSFSAPAAVRDVHWDIPTLSPLKCHRTTIVTSASAREDRSRLLHYTSVQMCRKLSSWSTPFPRCLNLFPKNDANQERGQNKRYIGIPSKSHKKGIAAVNTTEFTLSLTV